MGKNKKQKEPKAEEAEVDVQEVVTDKKAPKEDKKEEKKAPSEYQVFVSGIPYECSEEEFREFFSDIKSSIK